MSDGRFPSEPPPPPPVSPIVSGGRPWWQSWWFIMAAAVILIVGAAALIAGTTGGDDDDDTVDVSLPPPTTEEPIAAEPADDPPVATDPVITPPPEDESPATTEPDEPAATVVDEAPPGVEEVAGAPAGLRGDRTSPVPVGEIADIGEGWRLQVLSITEDGTDLVLDENRFNDPPREGSRFTLVEIALGYYGLDDPGNAFQPTVSGVASASVELDEDCGVIPDDFRTFVDVFSGGVLTGTICFVTTPSDAGTVQLYATTTFDGTEIFLDASATPSAPASMPTLPGPQDGAASTPGRLDPTPIGTPVDVGEGWTLTVTSPAVDITDAVAAENTFNDPPPDGARFVGIDVEYLYEGSGVASAFDVSTKMVGTDNVELPQGCGVIPNDADVFSDVFTGGTISGTLCYIVPADDIENVVLYASTVFDGPRFFFATRDGTGSSAAP